MMDMVQLKNGSEEASPLVAATLLTLEGMMAKDPMAFYELVELCRDRDHKVWGNLLDRWDGIATKTDTGYQVHESIRHVVASAVTGDGTEMTLCDSVDRDRKDTPDANG